MAFTMSFKRYEALQQKIGNKSFNQLAADFSRGNVTMQELKQFYSRQRDIVLKRERAAVKANLKFGGSRDIAKVKDLKDVSDVLHAIADANRYLAGKTTVTERKQVRDKAIETLHKNQMFSFVNKENYAKFAAVMDWLKSAGILSDKHSSESAAVEDFVEAALYSPVSTLDGIESLFMSIAGRVL